jgi:hypothetical protein
MIWIDVHPAGEILINTTRTLLTPVHVHPTYAFCGQSTYVATIRKLSIALDRPYCSREKGLPTQPQLGWVIHRSATQFLSQHSYWSSNESQTSVDSRLLGLSGPYHRHAISTFNTCSRGSTHRSLMDTGGGYNLSWVRLLHSTSTLFYHLSIAWANDDPPRDRITRVIRKVSLNAIIASYNSYKQCIIKVKHKDIFKNKSQGALVSAPRLALIQI